MLRAYRNYRNSIIIMGPINESATSFLHDLRRRISLVSGEDRQPQFLFQRISVAIQRFLHDGFFVVRPPGLESTPDFNFLHYFFFIPREYTYRGQKIIIKFIRCRDKVHKEGWKTPGEPGRARRWNSFSPQCFDTVGWAKGRASDL